MNEICIAGRFNGPADSGNGGYCCGLLATFFEGPCKVRLSVPPPLDKQLSVVRGANGGADLYDSEVLVGRATPCQLEVETPPAPSLAQAEKASLAFPCYESHIYPTCFVCGPGRPANDGLCLYPGPVADWDLLACPWRPQNDLLDDSGYIKPEVVWAALDCPGYFAAAGESMVVALLGEIAADIRFPVPGDQPLVVFSWPLGIDGRKRYAGVAIANESGQILARSRTTWIEIKQ